MSTHALGQGSLLCTCSSGGLLDGVSNPVAERVYMSGTSLGGILVPPADVSGCLVLA